MRKERLQDIRLSKRKLLKGRLKSNVASMMKRSRDKHGRNLKDRGSHMKKTRNASDSKKSKDKNLLRKSSRKVTD